MEVVGRMDSEMRINWSNQSEQRNLCNNNNVIQVVAHLPTHYQTPLDASSIISLFLLKVWEGLIVKQTMENTYTLPHEWVCDCERPNAWLWEPQISRMCFNSENAYQRC